MGLFLSEVNSEIKNTLSKRQDNLDADNIKWFSEKQPWVRLTSMASVDNNDNLRKKWILFGGLSLNNTIRSGFQEMYDSYSGRPMPGITDVSVSNKGAMGSTREATISFTCWDLEQLNTLELLYMTCGIHLLLEWGWSKGISNENVDINLSNYPPKSDRELIKNILDNVKQSGGHYDAMQGPVSNFSWNLKPGGGFDCSVTIVSVAEMFLEIDIHSTSKNITKSLIDSKIDDTEADKAVEENLIATLVTTLKTIADSNGYNEEVGFVIKMDTEKEMPELFKKSPLNLTGTQYYIRWSYLEEHFINKNLFYKIKEGGKEIISPRMDSNDLMINYDPFIISGDPGMCLLPLDKWAFSQVRINEFYVIPGPFAEAPIETEHGKRFHFSNILLNLEFVYTTYTNSKSLNDFLRTMLDSISDACGNYWEFSYQIDEDNPDIISVVDYKTVTPNKINPFVFRVNKKNSILTDVTLNTEVPGELKSIMMLGVNREENESSPINKTNGQQSNNEYNFYGHNIKNLALGGEYTPIKASKEDIGEEKVQSFNASDADWTVIDYIQALNQDIQRVYGYSLFGSKGASEENTNNLKNSLKKYVSDVIANSEYSLPDIPPGTSATDIWNAFQQNLNAANTKNKTSNDKSFTLIPLKLSFSLDGIGGLKFGNALHIDYLPTRYLNKAFFQITNVSHTISPGSWKTTVETIMSINNNSIAANMQPNNNFRTFNNESTATQEEIITPVETSTYETDDFHSANSRCNEHNNKGILDLHPDIKPMVRSFINQVEDKLKISVRITINSDGGYRSFATQTKLYNQGRTTPGNIVTYATAGQSFHNYGLAIDIYNDTNKTANISTDIAAIAQSLGFEWGGVWEEGKDIPHFQMTFGYTWQQLLNKHNKKEWDEEAPGYVKL